MKYYNIYEFIDIIAEHGYNYKNFLVYHDNRQMVVIEIDKGMKFPYINLLKDIKVPAFNSDLYKKIMNAKNIDIPEEQRYVDNYAIDLYDDDYKYLDVSIINVDDVYYLRTKAEKEIMNNGTKVLCKVTIITKIYVEVE